MDPMIIIFVAYMLLMGARNIHFSVFRKIVGIWLFANTAAHAIYSVLSRMGFSASYTSVLGTLRILSKSAQQTIREKAKTHPFLIIYDNINRMQRAWDPDLGQQDTVNNGTAATFVVVEDCDAEKAFDLKALEEKQAEQGRKALSAKVLFKRIDFNKLDSVFALHCLNFLVEEVPALEHHKKYISTRFRTSEAIHRMRDGRKTTVHPLATSDHNEGTTAGQARVFDDVTLDQLALEKEELANILKILGGDQASVEKARMLKKLLDDCPHGYGRYGWVLPLIQLWHMGWADLERVLATHWGKTERNPLQGDISSFCFTNTILKRKVKSQKRPDYYPTQRFVFDNLKAEIMDCWRTHLNAKNLERHFLTNPVEIEDLLKMSQQLAHQFVSTDAAERAVAGSPNHGFPIGTSVAVA